MNKKYQVFISSTYTDLIHEREKVRDTVLKMYQFPIGMEMFSAADEDQWEIIRDTIDSSDYYVLIIGGRYGTIIEEGSNKGISYTEKEYRYAKMVGVPILVFIKKDEAISADKIDDDPQKRKNLKNFIAVASKGREVEWFRNVEELGAKVSIALHKEMDRGKRPGWIRSVDVNIEKSLSEIVELSRHNRDLQEENRKLSAELEKLKSLSEREPLLTVSLGLSKPEKDEKHPDAFRRDGLIRTDEEGIIHLKLKSLSTNMIEAEYMPYTEKSLPMDVRHYITEQEIEEYNAALPSKEEMEEYLEEYRIYLRLKENGIPVTFYIGNNGSAKATDISVVIEFPDQLLIFDYDEIVDMPEPKAPEKPKDLIQKTYEKMNHEKLFGFEKTMQSLDAFGSIRDIPSLIAPSALRTNTIFESIEIKDNRVEIGQKHGIVQTKSDWFSGSYIVPIMVGEYEAKVTIMCAEYREPDVTKIRFVVEE